MTSRRLAILATYGHQQKNDTIYGSETSAKTTPSSKLHLYANINVILGGVMLSALIIFVVMICYCCHRNMRMNTLQPLYSSYWPNNSDLAVINQNVSTRVYNVATIAELYCREYHRPPPSYEYIMTLENRKHEIKKSPQFRLPTYEESLLIG